MSAILSRWSNWGVLLRTAWRSKLGGNIASLYAVQGLNYLVPLIVLPYLLRVLGPRVYGSIAFAQALMAYLTILTDFGFNFSATRAVSIAREDPTEIARIFWSTMAAKAALLILGVLAVAPTVLFVPTLRHHAAVIAICGLAVCGSVALPQWYYQGLERMRSMAAIQVGGKIVTLGLIFAFVHSPGDELAAAAFLSLSPLLAGIACFAAVPVIAPVRVRRPTLAEILSALSSSWHLFLSNAATSIYVNSNVFLLGLISGDYAVALYSLANKVALFIFNLMTPAVQAVFPRASLLFGSSVREGWAFVRRLSKYLLFGAGLLSLAVISLAPLIVRALGGARYAGAVPVLRIMGLLPIVLMVATVVAQIVMINLGLTRQLSRIYMVAGALSLTLLPILASRYQAIGAALSLLTVETVGPLLMMRAIRVSGVLKAA